MKIKDNPLSACRKGPGVNITDDILDPIRALRLPASQEPVVSVVMSSCGGC